MRRCPSSPDASARRSGALLPGPLTLLLPNRARRFPVACGPDPDTLGLRVPAAGAALAALGQLQLPLLQSSANLLGRARMLGACATCRARCCDAADLALDAGELPGVASTVIDLRDYQTSGRWSLRAGEARCRPRR